MMLIRTGNLRKSYFLNKNRIEVLKGIDMEIRQGSFTAIVGPSGSGKSTLLYILGCLTQPSEGTYLLDGTDVSSLSDRSLSQIRNRNIGFIFQTFNLIPQMTVLENTEIPLVHSGTARKERLEISRKYLKMVGLSHRLLHRPSELSGGEMQRAAIARALVTEPLLVLADEPTGNLDSKIGSEIIEILRSLNRSGKTVIIVTHSSSIAACADEIISLRDGRVDENH
jgi:putative ABC transport system ATP-binding protein